MFYQRSFQNAKIYKNLFRCTRQPLPGHSYFQTKCSSNIGLRKETSKLFHLIKEISAHPTYSNFKIHSKISTWHSKPKEVPLGSLLIMLKVTVQIIGPYWLILMTHFFSWILRSSRQSFTVALLSLPLVKGTALLFVVIFHVLYFKNRISQCEKNFYFDSWQEAPVFVLQTLVLQRLLKLSLQRLFWCAGEQRPVHILLKVQKKKKITGMNSTSGLCLLVCWMTTGMWPGLP